MDRHTRHFKVAFEEDTLEEFNKYRLKEEHDPYGVFNFVLQSMQFSFDYIGINEYAELLENGTWTGDIGLLNRSEVDFVPAPFYVTEERWDAVSFNYPYVCDDVTFLSKRPRYNPEIMAIFQTLTASVWLSLLISIIFVTLVFFVLLKYRYTLDDALLHVLAIGLNQEGYIIPKKAAEVVLVCTWLLSMALFTACFKSVLLSFLTFPPLTGVRTVPELADAIRAGKYSARAVGKEYLPLYLQESPTEDVRVIGENVPKNPIAEPEDLLDPNLDHNVVVIYQRAYGKWLQEKLFMSGDSMGFYLSATAVSRDFCCKDEMDMLMHRFLAAGIDQKINSFADYIWGFKHFSKLPDEDVTRKITITDISGAFIFLVVGYFLSACMLFIEFRIKRREMLLSSTMAKKKKNRAMWVKKRSL